MFDAMPLQPDQSLARGRFVLVKRLGRGGMGEVWLARDERLREPVALKFLPPEIRGDAGALDDLRRETARSHQLSHPNIVRIHDLYEDPDGMAFLVMVYIDGPTLAALRLQQPSRVLSWDFLRPLVAQLCAALGYAHDEKVIHRDLKPANLMVDSRGRLKLTDFGIAAVASDSMSRVSVRYSTSGTLPYMSPQQVTGKRPQTTDDIYALGATLYELLTSKPPFHSGDITHQVLHKTPEPMEYRLAALGIQNDIPPEAAALIMACLAKEPGQRPQSARAVAEWIGLELEVKPSAESLAAALFPQTPSLSEAAADEPAEEVRSKPAVLGRNLAAVGIVALVLTAAFWLRKDSLLHNRSNPPAAASVPGQAEPPGELQARPAGATPQAAATADAQTPEAVAPIVEAPKAPPPPAVGLNQNETGTPATIAGRAGSPGATDAPRITTQPASQSVLPGANVTVKVTVAGAGPFTYQWKFNGANLPNTNLIRTVAGNGKLGYSGDGGAATNASLNYPCGVALDAAGNLYIADNNNERIRKVDTKGMITTVAGNGNKGFSGDGGPAASASLDTPYGVALGAAANLYIADRTNSRIRKVDSRGIITTVAGNGSKGYSADGGPAANTSLNLPLDMTSDAFVNLYIADYNNNRIRKMDAQGIITTVAGNGNASYSGDGGAANDATLNKPAGVAFDSFGNLYIADCYNHRIRKVDTHGIITTVAGNGASGYSGDGGAATIASLGYVHRVAFDGSGNLYIADSSNYRIRMVGTTGVITTVAGNGYGSTGGDIIGGGAYSGDGGPATSASLNYPFAVAFDAAGNLYIADSSNHRIREVHFAGYPTRTLTNVNANNAGDYTVVVTTPHGSVTSNVARLTINTTR